MFSSCRGFEVVMALSLKERASLVAQRSESFDSGTVCCEKIWLKRRDDREFDESKDSIGTLTESLKALLAATSPWHCTLATAPSMVKNADRGLFLLAMLRASGSDFALGRNRRSNVQGEDKYSEECGTAWCANDGKDPKRIQDFGFRVVIRT